jgi:hypothetical protein
MKPQSNYLMFVENRIDLDLESNKMGIVLDSHWTVLIKSFNF